MLALVIFMGRLMKFSFFYAQLTKFLISPQLIDKIHCFRSLSDEIHDFPHPIVKICFFLIPDWPHLWFFFQSIDKIPNFYSWKEKLQNFGSSWHRWSLQVNWQDLQVFHVLVTKFAIFLLLIDEILIFTHLIDEILHLINKISKFSCDGLGNFSICICRIFQGGGIKGFCGSVNEISDFSTLLTKFAFFAWMIDEICDFSHNRLQKFFEISVPKIFKDFGIDDLCKPQVTQHITTKKKIDINIVNIKLSENILETKKI